MIITTISDGLGNQLFMYAAGYALAKKRGVPLWLEISRTETDALRRFELDKLNIACSKILSVHGLHWLPMMRPLGKLRRHMLKSRFRYYREREQFVYDENLLQQPDGTYLHGYWQHHSYFHHLREELRRLFTPAVRFGEAYDSWLPQLAKRNSVSVHVRRGDYVKIGCSISPGYYREAVLRMQELHRDSVFFIFSDDVQYAHELFAGMNLPCTVVLAESPEPTLCDFFLMRHCHHHIIANSSYSWWAAYLGEDDATVIAPVLPPWPTDFPLQEWHKIPADRQ